MADTVSRDEFRALEGCVSAVEHEVDGEKMLSRYILEQARRNGDDIAGIKTRLDRVETELHDVRTDVRFIKQDLSMLRRDLPTIVADSFREVLKTVQQK